MPEDVARDASFLVALAPILLWATVGLAALWAVLALMVRRHRAAYNLTMAESGRATARKPGFGTVDHAARDAALRRGDAFETEMARRRAADVVAAADAAPGSPAKAAWLARVGATVFAVASFGVSLVSAIAPIQFNQQAGEWISSWSVFSDLVRDNPFGFAVALVVIAIAVIKFVGEMKQS